MLGLRTLRVNFANLARVAATCRGDACEPYRRVARTAMANFIDYRQKLSFRCNRTVNAEYAATTCDARSVSGIFQYLEAVRQLSGMNNAPESFTCNCDTLRIQ